MNSIDMKTYYRGCVTMCQIFLGNAIDTYLTGLKTLQKESKKKRNISETMNQVTAVYDGIPTLGQHLANSLRLWQGQGATLEELCQLCGADYTQIRKHIPAPAAIDFADVVEQYQLDFADAGKRLPTWKDGCPLTLGLLSIHRQREIKSGL